MNQAFHPIPAEEVMAFLDGELPENQAAAVSAHLETCTACREVAEGFRGVSTQMAAWSVEPAPARMTYRVTSAVKPKRVGRPWLWGGVWATACLLVITMLIVPYRSQEFFAPPAATSALLVAPPAQAPPASKIPAEVDQGLTNYNSRARLADNIADQPRAFEPPMAAVRGSSNPAKPMVARTASLLLITKDFDVVRAAVERIVHQHQGYVAQLQVSSQKDAGRTINATLRVPAEQMDATLTELKRLGHVEQESQGGEEVTQQYTDLVARLSNARNTEQRLLDVLRQRTAKMSDVLEVEQEIARVRGEIEQMDAERRTLEKRVAMATVSVQINEEFKAQVNPGPPSAARRLWNAGVEGYRNLTDMVIGIAEFTLAYGPALFFWVLLLWFPARFGWKRLRALAS